MVKNLAGFWIKCVAMYETLIATRTFEEWGTKAQAILHAKDHFDSRINS